MKPLTHYENIFIKKAEKEMTQFNAEQFKKEFTTLYKIIVESILDANLEGYEEGQEQAISIIRGEK